MKYDKVNCNYGKSDVNIAFVFACPGKFELKNNKVLSGNTGKNLNLLLEKLYEWNKTIFPYKDRYDYLLTNASEYVYYSGYPEETCKTTLPKLRSDVYEKNNILRLCNELKNKKYVILFGEHARKGVKKSKETGIGVNNLCVIKAQ